MKMFKRLFSSLLAGMLALALLTGCGGSGILNPSTSTQRVTVVERGGSCSPHRRPVLHQGKQGF